jgi:acyl-CoA thioester hydrolase
VEARATEAVLDPGLTGQPARPIPGIDNGYLAGYRVRFDEAGPNGQLRTSALLRYAQDVAWRHSEALGFDRAWYEARGLGWVVRGCELEVREAIPIGHTLRVSTAVVGHRRIWARRLGGCRLADGRTAATVTTDWVLLDARNRVVRIPPDFGVAFTNPEVRSEILRVDATTTPPTSVTRLRVRPSDLDPLAHVNNAVYVDWLEEALGAASWTASAEALPRTYRLEYLASAAGSDELAVELHGTAAAWSAAIRRADGAELVRAEGGVAS